MLLLEAGTPTDAKAALVRAGEADANLAEARYHLAFALSAVGDYPGALRETRLALELNPYIPAPRFRLLIDLQFEEAGVFAPDLDGAERVPAGDTIDAFDFDPGSLDDVFGAGGPAPDSFEGYDEPETRIALPSTFESLTHLDDAVAAMSQGDFQEASSAVQRAVAVGGNRLETTVLQGEIYLARGFTGEAVERFRQVLDDLGHSDDPADFGTDVDDVRHRALQGAARSGIDLGRFDDAIAAARELTELAPGDLQARLTLADALYQGGRFDEAAAVLEAAREDAPEDVEVLTQLGEAYMSTGEGARAEAVLREALELNDNALGARSVLGKLLASADRAEEAAVEFRAALEVIPSYGEAAFALAELEASQGRLQVAINVLADLLTVDPYHLLALVRLGDLLWRAGMQGQAGVAYRRVLHFDPGHADALRGLERLAPGRGGDAPPND
jgi:tetratricopeptide (TPR) repeat protein